MGSSIAIRASGLAYENPRPPSGNVQVQHPSLVSLDGDELLATFDLDRQYLPMDYRTVVARSSDLGETWTVERPVLDSPPPSTTHSIRTSRLSDGSLMGLGLMNRLEDPQTPVVNRETFGRQPGDLFLVRSADSGRSWTGPDRIETPLVGPSWEICHHVVELADGRLLAPTATWRGWDGENPSGEQSPVFISDDGGRTWPTFGRSFDGRAAGLTHWEQSVVQLQDRRILAVSWVYDIQTGRTYPNEYAVSEDRGATFSPPMQTGLHAQTCKVLQLRDGRVLAVYRRHDRPGLWATTASLEGEVWTNLEHLPLWESAESGMSGRGAGIDELRGLKFGYPSFVQLPSGEVLVVFWCEEDGATHIRWTRLALD